MDSILKLTRYLTDSKVMFYINIKIKDNLKFELDTTPKPVEHTSRQRKQVEVTKPKKVKTLSQKVGTETEEAAGEVYQAGYTSSGDHRTCSCDHLC